MARILTFDIETSPVSARVWQNRVNRAYISSEQIREDARIIAFAAKFLTSTRLIYGDLRDGINDKNEKRLLETLREAMDKADVVVVHNGRAFDLPFVLAKFAAYDIAPPRPVQVFDTYLMSRKHFKFTRNSLEWIARALGCPIKKSTHKKFPGMELWDECERGNIQAWNEMKEYNKTDVIITEWVYLKLRSYVKDHPNVANINGGVGCPKCGSSVLEKAGLSFKKTRAYQLYRCKKCRSWVEDNYALKTIDGKTIVWRPT